MDGVENHPCCEEDSEEEISWDNAIERFEESLRWECGWEGYEEEADEAVRACDDHKTASSYSSMTAG